MGGASSRRKGAAGERELAEMWRVLYPDARRGIGQARAGGEVPDVDGVADFWIEGKRYKGTPPLVRALRQAWTANAGSRARRPHVVACGRSDRGAWLACLALTHLLDLLAEREELKRELRELRANRGAA